MTDADQPLSPLNADLSPSSSLLANLRQELMRHPPFAQMLAGDCARAVLRTLRGWLLSVPLQAKEGEVCASSTPF